MTATYLACFDVDQVHSYVFGTDALLEVRGASYLLTKLEQDVRDYIPSHWGSSAEVLYFAGGTGMVLARTKECADEVVRWVEQYYTAQTHTASITGVALPLAPATLDSGFGLRFRAAGMRIRERKDDKAALTMTPVEPFMQPCTACERHPASIVSTIDHQPVCASCEAKRRSFRERIGPAYRQDKPPNLGEIGERSRPTGYVGLVYADVNNTGQILSRLASAGSFQNFSVGLAGLVQSAWSAALAHLSQPEESAVQLLQGGDDLVIATTGDQALPAALDFARRFEEGSRPLLEQAGLAEAQPLTLGIGLVIAHDTFPIAAYLRLANQLLRQAKRRSAEESYRTSAVDFMVVTASGSSDLELHRDESQTQKAFVFSHGERNVRLTCRPYTLAEAEDLLELARSLKVEGFPRSQLHYLYDGLYHSQVEAAFRWARVYAHASPKHRPILDQVKSFGPPGDISLPPWILATDRMGEMAYISGYGDLVEIYPFVDA